MPPRAARDVPVPYSAVLESAGYLTVTFDAALEALLAAIVISLLSAAIPVWGAMRVTPADAFRKTI